MSILLPLGVVLSSQPWGSVRVRVLTGSAVQEEAFARHGRQLSEVSWQEGVENVGKEKWSKAVCSSVCLEIRRVRGWEALPHTLPGPSACMKPPFSRCDTHGPYVLLILFYFEGNSSSLTGFQRIRKAIYLENPRGLCLPEPTTD